MEKLIKQLEQLNKSYFDFQDLLRLSGKNSSVLRVILSRLVKNNKLIRLQRGIYQLNSHPINIEIIAEQLYFPSYLSLESALGDFGILNQKSYTYTFVTLKKSKKIILLNQNVVYQQVKPNLFFGYQKINNLYIALPEKALLDQLYFVSLGKAKLDFDELNLNELSKTKFLKLSKKFPNRTQRLAQNLSKNFGKISVTIR